VNDSKKKIEDLVAAAKKLTVKTDVNANKRKQKLEQANLDFAKERMTELKKVYDQMMEEKKVRDEEQAFSDQIDALYNQTDELQTSLNNLHERRGRLEFERDEMVTAAADKEKVQRKIDNLEKQINGNDTKLQELWSKIDNLNTSRQRKQDEARSKKEFQEGENRLNQLNEALKKANAEYK
jgi:chromosome segregation ATPase